MSTVEEITEKVRALPDELQQETMHYIEFLLARYAQDNEAREWARFSEQQLATQYTAADAVYDQD